MSTERILQKTTWLPRPLEEVFAFFADAANLEKLTPDFLRFQILTKQPVEMKPGALIDYRIKVRGLPMRWRTRISVWEPPHRFVDEQLKGPYRMWIHEHTFRAVDGGTEVGDFVRYRVPGWILEPVLHRIFVGPDVERIFRYRQEILEKLFS